MLTISYFVMRSFYIKIHFLQCAYNIRTNRFTQVIRTNIIVSGSIVCFCSNFTLIIFLK